MPLGWSELDLLMEGISRVTASFTPCWAHLFFNTLLNAADKSQDKHPLEQQVASGFLQYGVMIVSSSRRKSELRTGAPRYLLFTKDAAETALWRTQLGAPSSHFHTQFCGFKNRENGGCTALLTCWRHLCTFPSGEGSWQSQLHFAIAVCLLCVELSGPDRERTAECTPTRHLQGILYATQHPFLSASVVNSLLPSFAKVNRRSMVPYNCLIHKYFSFALYFSPSGDSSSSLHCTG